MTNTSPSMGPRVSVDYGTATTKAILTQPGQPPHVLTFDGNTTLPSSIYVAADGTLVSGQPALHRAGTGPERLILNPARHLNHQTVTVGGHDVDVTDLIAATLWRVADEAATAAGEPVTDATLVVPASWGPRRRNRLRHAADRAGFTDTRIMTVSAAIGEYLLANGHELPVGAVFAVCDLGATMEASVARRTADDFETLAAIEAPDGGGLAIDTALAEQLSQLTRTTDLLYTRTVKDQLIRSGTAVTVVDQEQRPIIIQQDLLGNLAVPALAKAAHTTRETIDAASPDTPDRLYLIGGTSRTGGAAAAIAAASGVTTFPFEDAEFVAVQGAAAAVPAVDPDDAPPTVERASLVDLLTGAAAMVGAILLAVLFANGAQRIFGPDQHSVSVAGRWGLVAAGAVLAVQAAIMVALVFPTRPYRQQPADLDTSGGVIQTPISHALQVAAAISLAAVALYAVTVATHFDAPSGQALRWTLLPAAPVAGAAVAVGILARTRRHPPGGAWLRWLAFPISAIALVTIGLALLQRPPTTTSTTVLAADNTILLTRIGAALAAAGVGLTLARTSRYRAVLVPVLVAAAVAVADTKTVDTIGVAYAIAVTAWWLRHAIHLVTTNEVGIDEAKPAAVVSPNVRTDYQANATDAKHTQSTAVLAQRTATPVSWPAPNRPPGGLKPPSRRVIIAAIAIVIALSTTVILLASPGFTQQPQPLVRTFFDALAKHNGEQLRGLGICNGSPACTKAGLAVGYEPPHDVQLLPARRVASVAANSGEYRLAIPVRYQLAGQTFEDDVVLTRDRRGLFGHEWRISQAPGESLLLTNTDRGTITLAGIDIVNSDQPDNDPSGVWSPPGIYTAAVAADLLFNAVQTTITVGGGSHHDSVVMNRTIRSGVAEEVDRQVRSRINQCATQSTFRPRLDQEILVRGSCPFSYDDPYPITEQARWTIDKYPALSLHIEPDGTITTQTTRPGTATVRYRWTTDILEPRQWTRGSGTSDITITGHVRVDNNKIVWEPS